MPTVVSTATAELANSRPTTQPSTRLRARMSGRMRLNTNRAPSSAASAASTTPPRSSMRPIPATRAPSDASSSA